MNTHGTCFNCGEHVGEESYCDSCRAFVCSTCDVNWNADGKAHDPDSHLRFSWEEDEEEDEEDCETCGLPYCECDELDQLDEEEE